MLDYFCKVNTSILIRDTPITQSPSTCQESKHINNESEISGIKRCEIKEFNRTISCSEFSQQNCVLELPPNCNVILGDRQVICFENDLHLHKNHTTLITFPDNIKTLHFVEGNVVEIIENAFITLNGLEKLDMSLNRLSQVHAGAFAGLKSLNELNLTGNLLQTLHNETFSDLITLTRLYLGDNKLIVFPRGLFNHLKKQTVLFIHSNQLDTFKKRDLPELKLLALQNNNLSILARGLFDGLENLEILLLHVNHINTSRLVS